MVPFCVCVTKYVSSFMCQSHNMFVQYMLCQPTDLLCAQHRDRLGKGLKINIVNILHLRKVPAPTLYLAEIWDIRS